MTVCASYAHGDGEHWWKFLCSGNDPILPTDQTVRRIAEIQFITRKANREEEEFTLHEGDIVHLSGWAQQCRAKILMIARKNCHPFVQVEWLGQRHTPKTIFSIEEVLGKV